MIDHDNLDAFADAEGYDIADPTDTGGEFYRALAQEAGGSVLEIGCGTGRVTIPIADMGYPVTGLDVVPGMIVQGVAQVRGAACALGGRRRAQLSPRRAVPPDFSRW